MDQQKVRDLVEEALAENNSLFLIKLEFLANNKIFVEVDGDEGVSLEEIIRISRNVEHNLDREEDDFSLEVTSADISEPLKVKRQYVKNIGRILQVTTTTEKLEGTLKEANEDNIVLVWKVREPKTVGKGKVTVNKELAVLYDDIKQAKVKIVF
jgi:ribosome maturation factor RimP